MVWTRLSGEIYIPSGNRLPVLQLCGRYHYHYTELLWITFTLWEAEELAISWFKYSCFLTSWRAGRGNLELKAGISGDEKLSLSLPWSHVWRFRSTHLCRKFRGTLLIPTSTILGGGKSHQYPLNRMLGELQDRLGASKNLRIDPRFHYCPACSLVTVHSVASMTQNFITALFISRSDLLSSKSFNQDAVSTDIHVYAGWMYMRRKIALKSLKNKIT